MINFFICLLSYWSPVWLWWFEEEFIFHFYEKFYFCSHIGLQYDNKIFKFWYICFLFVFLLIYNDWLWSPHNTLDACCVPPLASLDPRRASPSTPSGPPSSRCSPSPHSRGGHSHLKSVVFICSHIGLLYENKFLLDFWKWFFNNYFSVCHLISSHNIMYLIWYALICSQWSS